MALLKQVVVGMLLCLWEAATADFGQNRVFSGSMDGSADDDAISQSEESTDGNSPARTREGVKILPLVRRQAADIGRSSGTEIEVTIRDAESVLSNPARGLVPTTRARIGGGHTPDRQPKKAALGARKAFTGPDFVAGSNGERSLHTVPGSSNAGSGQVFPGTPHHLMVDTVRDTTAREALLHSGISKVPAARRVLYDSMDSHEYWEHNPLHPSEEEVLYLLTTAGVLERVIVQRHYLLLAIRLFETRGRSFLEKFGRYPDDKVFERFFRSAEAGTLEQELKNAATMKLFLYCMHLEARDLTRRYLFSIARNDVFVRTPSDFDATLALFSHTVKNGTLDRFIEDEAERYLFYRFFVGLNNKLIAEGTVGDISDVDKYMINMVLNKRLQSELEEPEGRKHIVELIMSKPGVLNGLPLPPPRNPQPSPPPEPPIAPDVPVPPPGPKPDPPVPRPEPPVSAVTSRNFTAWLTALLSVGAVAASI